MAAPHINASSTVIDDRDSQIEYTGSWTLAGTSGELEGTSHGTNVTGSQAIFFFNTTSVAVYGTVPAADGKGPAVTSYVIDGSSAVTFTAPTTNSTLYQIPFFGAGGLAEGKVHCLTITYNSAQSSEFWLDYILTCNDADGASAKPKSKAGPIAGGVLGALAFISAGVLLFLWLRRRKQRREVEKASVAQGFNLKPEMSQSSLQGPKEISAFSAAAFDRTLPFSPPGTSRSAAHPYAATSYGSSSRSAGISPLLPYGVSQTRPHTSPTTPTTSLPSASSTIPRRKPVPQAPPSAHVTPRFHEDGGVRLQGGRIRDSESMLDIPPVYREY